MRKYRKKRTPGERERTRAEKRERREIVKRPFISLSDALRAAAALDPRDDETRDAIIHLLGLEAVAIAMSPSIGAWKPSSSQNVSTAKRHAAMAPGPLQAPARMPQRRQAPADRSNIRSTIKNTRKGDGMFKSPEWLGKGEVLGSAQSTGAPPPMPQLFGRLWRRGILSAALATDVPEGDLDLERLLEIIGAGRPLDWLPRLPTATLRRGVQVLLDLSAGMDPFHTDQQNLVQALDDILADDRLEVLYFSGCPDRGVGPGPRKDWGPWKAPARGTPILAVTDLGMGGPLLDDSRAMPGEWLRFARRLKKRGHLLLGLVPYEATRWPAKLTRTMKLIHWSERTSVGAVRRAMKDAR